MFALRSRTAIRCARAPLETLTTLRILVTTRAVFSTSVAVRNPEVDAAEQTESGPRIPLSIQANYYEPLRRTPTHGYPVCDLQLRSYSVRNLEFMCDFALRAAYYVNLPASGPVPLPKKIERWTVPRGNFVHKKSQENFERITYKRLIQIKDGSPETVELWLAFLRQHQYHGVGMKANVWSWEEIGVGKKMNVSLETLRDDVPRPKWAHFGPRKNSDTAAMAQEILNSPEYKALEQNSEELPFAESAAEAVEETAVEAESLEVNASEPAVEEVKLSEKTEEPVLKGCASEKASEIVTKGKEAVVSEKAEVVAAEGQAGAGAPEETKESAPKEEMVKSEESLPVEGWIKAAEGIEEFVTKEQTEDLKEPEKSGETTTTINSEVKTPEPEKK